MSGRTGPFGLIVAVAFMLLSVSCSTKTTAISLPAYTKSPAYTKEVCRDDLRSRLELLLKNEKGLYFYDNGKSYRSLDVGVDFYKGADVGKDLTISIRNVPLAYWGFNVLTGEQTDGLPGRARAKVDKEAFRGILDLRCPAESSLWDTEDPSHVTHIQNIFNNILMYSALNGASPMQMDFLGAFGEAFDPYLKDLAVEIRRMSGVLIFCLNEYFDFFSDAEFRKLKVAVGTNCELYEDTNDSRLKAFIKINDEMDHNKFLVVFETEFEIKPDSMGTTREEMAKNLKADIKSKADVLAQKTIEVIKKYFVEARSF